MASSNLGRGDITSMVAGVAGGVLASPEAAAHSEQPRSSSRTCRHRKFH